MEKIGYLLVGGGIASAKCAAALRREGASGRIAIVGAEANPPYNRPPLSKGLPLGRARPDTIRVFKDEFYIENDIEIFTGAGVVSVDGAAKTATDAAGRRYKFDHLLAATGTTPRKLGVDGSDLGNIFYLRTVDESLAIVSAMKSARSAVIVGAGFIGMELASAFRQNGLKTTMLVRESSLFSRLGSPVLSKFFEDYYLSQGVEIIYGDSTAAFQGRRMITGVLTEKAAVIDCDLAAVGIGVSPEVDWLVGSGAELDNGVVVDEYLRSAHPDIYAAGDCANFYDPIFEKQRRIEHWDNAIKQGELAALNMLGKEVPYNTVAYFFSDIFDLSWEWLGDNSGADETIIRGSLAEKSAMVLFLKQSKLKAAFLLMQGPDERHWVERAIMSGADFSGGSAKKLADASVPLESLGQNT